MRWLCATVAPWALGAGLVVSFTATAGVNLDVGYSIETPSPVARAAEAHALVAPVPRDLAGRLAERIDAVGLGFSEPIHANSFAAFDPGLPPRHEPKAIEEARPASLRAGRGDPAGRVPISLSRRGVELGADGLSPSLLAPSEAMLPPAPILYGEALPLEVGVAGTFEPTFDFDATPQLATTERTPEAVAQGSSGIGIAHGAPGEEGGTPLVARAASLSSTTPASPAWSPVVVSADPVSMRVASAVALAVGPRYLDLIDRGRMARERRCLAEAVYFEARSEPEAGQAAVAQVVLNRVESRLYPNTICGVVYQNRHRHLACQFTFACEGRSLRINEPGPWRRAQRIADSVLEGETYLAKVGGATHYHADYVNPRWASRLINKGTIGRHIFYQLRPGQR